MKDRKTFTSKFITFISKILFIPIYVSNEKVLILVDLWLNQLLPLTIRVKSLHVKIYPFNFSTFQPIFCFAALGRGISKSLPTLAQTLRHSTDEE